MVLNGTVGARLHVPFPVLNRSSFGFWFSYFSVISRVVLAMFWFGIQTFVGSECVYQVRSTSRYPLFTRLFLRCPSFPQMLKAIWASIARLPNHLPPSANITTTGTCLLDPLQSLDSSHAAPFIGMICYFLYWLLQLPFMLISPQKIRWLFLVKAIIVPPTWLALLIWAFVKVPPNSSILAQKAKLSGSALSWAWLSALNSTLGLYATLGVNIPDFTVSHIGPLPRPSVLIIQSWKLRDTRRTKERT